MTGSKVLLIQPGLQHSHQLAWALHSAGSLDQFWSGVPVRPTGLSRPAWIPSQVWLRMREVGMPAEAMRVHPHWWVMMRLAMGFGDRAMRFRNMHRVLYTIDRMAAQKVAARRPKVVIAYENTALHIFEAAKKVGARCVLDAASFHFQRGNELLVSADPEFQPKIDARKQREIDLADHIICCSKLARESYIRAGIDPAKVIAMPLGASLPVICVDNDCTFPENKPIKLAYAGAMHTRKSIDLILEVMAKLHVSRPGSVELHIFGGSDSSDWIKLAQSIGNVRLHGPVAQTRLFGELARVDALLLPSRFDSFGMVVAEAMAVGTPAIVSDQTGAKSIIEEYPGAGWIITADAHSIEGVIRNLIDNPTKLWMARKHARLASQNYRWDSYRERVAFAIGSLL